MSERVTYSKSMSAPTEYADRDPAFFFYVREQIGRDLANTLLDKIEVGEKIVGLQEIKTEQIDLYRVKYSRYINVEDIVRCKDCKYSYNNDGEFSLYVGCPMFDDWICDDEGYTEEGYCYKAERRTE